MKINSLYEKLHSNQHKFEIINKIMELHPGEGTDIGWSWYHGGMEDTGEWKIDTLLSIPLETLEYQYNIWITRQQIQKTKQEELDKLRKRCEAEGDMEPYYNKVFGDRWPVLRAWAERNYIPLNTSSILGSMANVHHSFSADGTKITYNLPESFKNQ